MEYIAAANAALALLEILVPKIQELAKSGAITPAQQTELLTRYNSLKNSGDAAFSGPEWKQD